MLRLPATENDSHDCKQAVANAVATADAPKKAPGQIIKYNKEFLLKFMDVSVLGICSCYCLHYPTSRLASEATKDFAVERVVTMYLLPCRDMLHVRWTCSSHSLKLSSLRSLNVTYRGKHCRYGTWALELHDAFQCSCSNSAKSLPM